MWYMGEIPTNRQLENFKISNIYHRIYSVAEMKISG